MVNRLTTVTLTIMLGLCTASSAASALTVKGSAQFPSPNNSNEIYSGVPAPLTKTAIAPPWSGYCPPCTLKDKSLCAKLPCQTHNIEIGNIYRGIEVKSNKWMQLANQIALNSVRHGGGPFGVVIVQINDQTGKVIRYWQGSNHVAQWNDPTAHAEIVTIRKAAKALGVFDLGHIQKSKSLLPQPGPTSHVEIYSSAEPCPMCIAAIYWAHIPVLVFAATRFDAAQPGVDFSDAMIYSELKRPYDKRRFMKAYHSVSTNSLDAFNLWKRSNKTPY